MAHYASTLSYHTFHSPHAACVRANYLLNSACGPRHFVNKKSSAMDLKFEIVAPGHESSARDNKSWGEKMNNCRAFERWLNLSLNCIWTLCHCKYCELILKQIFKEKQTHTLTSQFWRMFCIVTSSFAHNSESMTAKKKKDWNEHVCSVFNDIPRCNIQVSLREINSTRRENSIMRLLCYERRYSRNFANSVISNLS